MQASRTRAGECKGVVLNFGSDAEATATRDRTLLDAGFEVRHGPAGNAPGLVSRIKPTVALIGPLLGPADAVDLCRGIRSAAGAECPLIVRLFGPSNEPECTEGDVWLPDSIEPAVLVSVLRALLRARRATTFLPDPQHSRSGERYQSAGPATGLDRRELESAINSMNEGLAVFGRDGELIMMNPAALRLHGFRNSSDMSAGIRDVLSLFEARKPDGSIVAPEERPTMRALAGEVVTGFEELLVRRDTGQWFIAEYSAAPVRNEAGEVDRAVVTIRDITKLKSAERELRESEERLRLAQTSAQVGVFDWRPQTGDQEFTPELERLYGCTPGTLKNHDDWRQRVHPEDIARVEEEMDEALAAREGFEVEFRILTGTGETRWMSSKGAAIYDEAGNTVRILGVNVDITERKQAEQALRQAQKLESIGVLAGGIAHDFNNLLTSILGNASLALLDAPERITEQLRSITESSEKAAGLTRQLLAYAGKGQFQITDVDMAKLVRSTAELIRVSIPKSIELVLDIPERLPVIWGDAAQIHQVIMNLVINAAEAIGERKNGTVWISAGVADPNNNPLQSGATASAPERCLFVTVRDNGSGMEEAVRARIFDPFFTTKFTGRGLGLAAVQGILRSHKGAITVESKPGEGTTFTVYLPGSSKTASVSHQRKTEPAPQRPATVLVAEDEPQIRMFTKSALERMGHTVLLAENGEQALETLKAGARVDIVLLDVIMPVAGGVDILPAIREGWPEVAVLVSSGYSREEVRRLGIDEDLPFLEKPYTALDLAAATAEALARSSRIHR